LSTDTFDFIGELPDVPYTQIDVVIAHVKDIIERIKVCSEEDLKTFIY